MNTVLLVCVLAGCAATSITPAPTPESDGITPTLPVIVPPTVTGAPILPGEAPPSAPESTSPAAAEAAPPPTSPPPAVLTTHTVQSGDTLLGIALKYGIPMAAIQLQNDKGASTVVRLGEQLAIPAPAAWTGASPYWVVYQVNAGDTLSEIAKAYGATVAEIEAANGLSAADYIYVEQLLILPLRNLAVARAPDPTPRPATPTPAPTTGTTGSTPAPVILPTPTAAAPPPADVASWPYETARIMNAVRAEHGLPPLAYNETLAQAAQIQANDCMQRGWCSHTGSDGSDIKQRVLRVGYNPASWAECWAQRLTPQGAIDIWMDEIPPNDPHRRTLLTTWLTEVGIGVAKTSWGYYFIAVFGRPR